MLRLRRSKAVPWRNLCIWQWERTLGVLFTPLSIQTLCSPSHLYGNILVSFHPVLRGMDARRLLTQMRSCGNVFHSPCLRPLSWQLQVLIHRPRTARRHRTTVLGLWWRATDVRPLNLQGYRFATSIQSHRALREFSPTRGPSPLQASPP